MTGVFLDTVGLLALWDGKDQWHEAAVKAYSGFSATPASVFSTAYILLECGNSAARKPYRMAPERLRVQLEERGALIHPTDDDWLSAWAAYRRGQADNAGIVDQVSFAVMRRLGITDVFTNDRHFKAAGFTTLF